ncbi:MAG TPA: GvpL/GvpF family gas vesicle protein [Thermoanaerobaculia bacterium]
MKSIAIGAHLLRDDIEPVAEAIPVGDLFLSALSVPDDQPLGDRDLLLRIAGVRAKLLDVATFIAIRYGFAFASAEDAQSKCLGHLTRWKRVLTRNRDHVEMTLKVAASSPQVRPDRHAFASGAEYLRALHAATQSASVDPSFREAVERTLVPLATKHRWSHRDEKSVELTALIDRARLDDVRSAGEELRAGSPHVPFLLSGPWPLEVFADDDHE